MKDFANLKYTKSGVSLMELLIVIALVGLVGVLVAAIFFNFSGLFSTQQISIAVSEQNNIALGEMVAQTRQSQKVVATCAGCGGSRTDVNTLILRAWPTDAAGNPIHPAGCFYDYIIYQRDSAKNTLLKTVIPDTNTPSNRKALLDKVIATSVEELEFFYDDNSNPASTADVKTNVKTQASTLFGKTQALTQEAKAALRNR